MKRLYITIIVVLFVGKTFAQMDFSPIFNPNSANMVLQSQMMYLQAKREMDQRVISLSQQLQPYREEMRKHYNNEEYKLAIDVYFKALDYLHYRYDHLAVEDMALLAGKCAEKLGNNPLAIEIYKIGGQQDMTNFTPNLNRLSNSLLDEAEKLIISHYTNIAREKIIVAQSTGVNNGRCILLLGKSYEFDGNYSVAMDYYKQAKKDKYYGAKDAIKALKAKMKNNSNKPKK